MKLSLETTEAAAAALERIQKDRPRTSAFSITNATQNFTLTLVLGQGLDTTGDIWEGYQADTGVTVVGQNVQPGTTQTGLVQAGINVLTNLAKCSAEWKLNVPPFKKGTLHFEDLTASPGKYFPHPHWRVIQTASLRGDLEKEDVGQFLAVESFELPRTKR